MQDALRVSWHPSQFPCRSKSFPTGQSISINHAISHFTKHSQSSLYDESHRIRPRAYFALSAHGESIENVASKSRLKATLQDILPTA
ncbi:hypothetical protein CaCOL14_001570 [Colletotrichum acutatum]